MRPSAELNSLLNLVKQGAYCSARLNTIIETRCAT